MKLLLPSALVALALSTAYSKPLKGQISVSGGNAAQAVFVVSIDDTNVTYSTSPNGSAAKSLPLSRVDGIEFVSPEGWDDADDSYKKGNLETAATRFGKLADEYSSIARFPDSYGARARYFEMESLRKLGKSGELTKAVAKMEKSGIKLDPAYEDQLNLYPAWAAAGKEDWRSLKTIIATYEKPAAGEAEAVEIKDLPSSQFVQVAYLRGLLHNGMDDKSAALKDFTSAMVLNFGQEPAVAGQATLGVLDILAEDPEANKNEAYALTQVYKTQFGGGKLPSKYDALAKKPEELE